MHDGGHAGTYVIDGEIAFGKAVSYSHQSLLLLPLTGDTIFFERGLYGGQEVTPLGPPCRRR